MVERFESFSLSPSIRTLRLICLANAVIRGVLEYAASVYISACVSSLKT